MKVIRISPFTQKRHEMEIDVTSFQLDRWRQGMLIQKAMPHLTADEREFIKTGLTAEEFDAAFKSDDE